MSKSDSWIDMGVLEDCVRNHLNEVAPRRIGVLDPVKLRLTYCSAGHEPPLIFPARSPRGRSPRVIRLTAGGTVVGPLAESEVVLTSRPVVTTTWKEWRAAHPETTVLALDTGHERDYGRAVRLDALGRTRTDADRAPAAGVPRSRTNRGGCRSGYRLRVDHLRCALPPFVAAKHPA